MITSRQFQMNQILSLNNPEEVDFPLSKYTNQSFERDKILRFHFSTSSLKTKIT